MDSFTWNQGVYQSDEFPQTTAPRPACQCIFQVYQSDEFPQTTASGGFTKSFTEVYQSDEFPQTTASQYIL